MQRTALTWSRRRWPSPAKLSTVIGGSGLATMPLYLAYAQHHLEPRPPVWPVLFSVAVVSFLIAFLGTLAELLGPVRNWRWVIASLAVTVLAMSAFGPLLSWVNLD